MANSNSNGSSVGGDAESRAVICVVGSDLKDDRNLIDAFKAFDVDVKFSATGDDFIGERDCSSLNNVAFVYSNFDDEIFLNLRKVTAKIFGPLAIKYYAQIREPLPAISRPLFCASMNKVTVCFSGFKKKDELQKLVDLVHHMGGSVRKDFSPSVTHLVANVTSGEKYHYAVSLGKPVMMSEWILNCWENNYDTSYAVSDLTLSCSKLKPFVSCVIAFVGFTVDEKEHMEELAVTNGGEICSNEDPRITHIVLEEDSCSEMPVPERCEGHIIYLVKTEWFWASIQMEVRAEETIYKAKLIGENVSSGDDSPFVNMTPNSRAARKRKRLKDTLGHLANHDDIESASSPLTTGLLGTKQRRSAEMTLSPSFLDATISPPPAEGPQGREWRSEGATISSGINTVGTPVDLKTMSPRQQVCYELLQTETNYAGILHTIITVIKEPIEDLTQVGGPLLEPTDVKIIFGNLHPIYEVHRQLRDDLSNLINVWKDENSVGNIILKYSQDLLKAYPPFINFFEKTKETLLECDATKPRFHAFLKICQNKPECGRQSLVELLIRPVQRLPSIVLLLNDILKHTPKNNPDSEALDAAIQCLKEIMTHINEDKRKTEGQVAMFVIVNDIENCPANLLSSHRNFVTKADMIELGNELSGKGVNLTMFLFTDMLEICKRRKCALFASSVPIGIGSGSSGTPLSMRSPSVVSLHTVKATRKNYKHIELLPLSHIKRVVDIKETEGYHNVFALICRSNLEIRERLYTFSLVTRDDEESNDKKFAFLRILCRQLANSVCRPDAESFLASLEPHHLGISSSDIGTNTLSKAAVRIASKTSRKVSRAFSFTKSPHKLSRAISTMMTPKSKNENNDGSPEFNSPLLSSSKRLPCNSAMNLQDLESRSQAVPMTPGIGKKLKSFTIGPSTSLLKRL